MLGKMVSLNTQFFSQMKGKWACNYSWQENSQDDSRVERLQLASQL